MIGAKDILFFGIQLGATFRMEGNKDKGKQQTGPPTIYNSDQLKLLWKKNGYTKERQQYQEQQCKDHHTVSRMNKAKHLHAIKIAKLKCIG